MLRVIFGFILGLAALPLVAYLWLAHGHPPVAVADAPLPYEGQITHIALQARIDKELAGTVPVEANEATFVAGAQVYRERCAMCHGLSGTPSAIGEHMAPDAPPLWEKHGNSSVVGVSDDPAAETYWKVANGIRLTGMPSYRQVLTETQMWQVSVLLANADKALPPAAVTMLKEPMGAEATVSAPAAGGAKVPTVKY